MTAAAQTSAPALPVLEDLYRDQMELAWRTARYLGVPASDAEDVVHEVFIVVQRRLADYDPAYSVRSWIAGITRRVVLHYHRSRTRSERKIARVEAPAQTSTPPDEAVSRGEAAAFLETFIAGLPTDKRDAFVLGELEGLSAPEIAHVVGHNVNTVYSRLRSARRAFQESVDRLETIRRREGG